MFTITAPTVVGQFSYTKNAPNGNGNKHYKNVPQQSLFAVLSEIVPDPESHRSVVLLSSSQTPYQSFPCKHEKLFHFIAPPLPKKQMLFGDPTVFAKSYHFQTVIQLSRCIKVKKSSPPMNRGKDFYRRYHARQTKKHRMK